MPSKYHLYQREDDGPWYYWYTDDDGRRLKKSTGRQLKREAQGFIDDLEDADAKAKALALRKRSTFREVADPMFLKGAEHLERWARKGRGLRPQTYEQHRRWVDLYLLPKWGSCWVDEIQAVDFEDWLADLPSKNRGEEGAPLSSSTRNSIARTFLLVMGEARRDGFIAAVPELELDRRHSQKKDILLDSDLDLLFPEDVEALADIWCFRPKRERDREPREVGIMFGVLFCHMVSAGLRPGEGRAVHLDQLYKEIGGMIVDRAFDDRNELGAPKKSKENDPRYRVAYIPEKTWRIIDFWLTRRKEDDPESKFPGLLYSYHGKPIGTFYLEDRFSYGLKNAGIVTEGRILTPHSCRYTYDTKMRNVLPPDVLREFIGHRDEQMTDHYDRATLRPALESRLKQLVDQRPKVERFWELDVPAECAS